jgi:hypothetical protein
MIDQLIIEDKASFDDFGASVRERKINAPTKKIIKETVPFSNTTYDFTKINGEPYWEEGSVEYIFEILADTPEELEEKKIAFSNWIMLVQENKLYDPFLKDYHFKATFAEIDFDDSEIEKSTISVKFTTYPFKISNEKKVYSFNIGAGNEVTTVIINDSSCKIVPTIESTENITVKMNDSTFGLSSGTTESENFEFETGVVELTIKNTSENEATVVISFNERVL